MSAPVLWIFLPALFSVLLYLLRQRERAVTLLGTLFAFLLALLAWNLPIGRAVPLQLPLLPPTLELADTLTVLGRRFILDDSARAYLIVIYGAAAFWFGGAFRSRVSPLFVPLGLTMAALLTAALAVEPFLYAALLIEMAALVSAPILSPPGRPVGRGVLRFLTFQTLGMPFILFSGWLMTGAEAGPADPQQAGLVAALLGLGFAFLIGIFPFHTWLPMLGEESHPYAAAFIFFLLPLAVAIFGQELLERFAWLRQSPEIYTALRYMGVVMVVTGGVWAALQRHLGRVLGYAAMVEIGFSLLAVSLVPPTGRSPAVLGIFFAQMLPRGLGLALWGQALALIRDRVEGLRFRSVQGLASSLPLAAVALIVAQFSLGGFPLTAGFPMRIELWSALAAQSLPITLLSLLGNAGLLMGGLRTLAVLVTGPGDEGWRITEGWQQALLLIIGLLLLLLVGVAPQLFLPYLADMARLFGSR